MTTTMTPERKLQRVKITLLRNPKFALLSGILMVGKTFVDDKTPTARTNGRDETYGTGFIKMLSEKELAFVVLHEAMHKMYRHLTTWRKLHDEDAHLANCACDYVINLQLRDLDPYEVDIAMPKDKDGKLMGLVDERFRGLNAKQVFDILKQEQKNGGGGGDGEGEGGFDDHDWDGAKELTEEQKKELEREIDQAIRQGVMAEQKAKGSSAGGLARELGDLLEPKIDWRDVLREFVKSVCAGKDVSTWRKPNRRFLGGDVYMPTLVSETVGHIVLAIDTSGSIGGSELNAFLSESKAIFETVRPEMVDLLYWGSSVVAHETYGPESMDSLVQSTKPVGGGGTSPTCITEYMKEKKIEPECVIVLTDGYVGDDWGSAWSCPVLWCIVGGNTVVAPNGKTVHVTDWE
jgi:predicted metal-dependent peptidase